MASFQTYLFIFSEASIISPMSNLDVPDKSCVSIGNKYSTMEVISDGLEGNVVFPGPCRGFASSILEAIVGEN